MKKLVFTILAALLIYTRFSTGVVAQDTGWTIDNFHSEIVINEDASVTVREKIEVDFGGLKKHGIYRDIPTKYSTLYGNNYKINLDVVDVVDERGRSLTTDVNRGSEKINIRIGDADKTITGENTYIITYKVDRVLQEREDGVAEFYWNVTGTSWSVPINRASATVKFPGEISETICFVGGYGSVSQSCSQSSSGMIATFNKQKLSPASGLTISLKGDSSAITFPSNLQKTFWFIRDNSIYSIPIIVFFVMFYIYWENGRDRRFKDIFHETAGYEYVSPFERKTPKMTFAPPKHLSPGEVGVIVDEKVDNRDITAVAIDLARRGYFTIKESEKGKIFKKSDFELKATGKDESELNDFEVKLLDLFFHGNRINGESMKLSDMPKDAYKKQKEVVDAMYKHLTSNGYFIGNPNSVRIKYSILGTGVLTISWILIRLFNGNDIGLSTVLVVISSALIIIAFSKIMPARSARGRKALEEIVGLREYVRVGAWRQQKFENWGYFEEILPYTIAFGLTHKFIDAFKDAKIPKPDWYESKGTFRPLYFAASMDNFGSNMNSGINATKPRSSSGSGFGGGGFSGGGFGGGGGGSW